jgi:predicted enzyme related to lactoylglutathione lyase
VGADAGETGRIAWHELQAPDVDAATRFYTELLGWEIEVWKPEEADYPMIHDGGAAHGGFQRMHPDSGIGPRWVPYVLVEDADATAASAREAGASVRVEPFTVRDVGRLTFVVDPEGAEIAGIVRQPPRPYPEGVFVWDELHVEDIDSAKRYYSEVFGWTIDATDDGYPVFRTADRSVAGLTRRSNTLPLPTWLPYLATADIDAAMGRARQLGAMVADDVRQMEGVGRYARIQDPVGAFVGLLESER